MVSQFKQKESLICAISARNFYRFFALVKSAKHLKRKGKCVNNPYDKTGLPAIASSVAVKYRVNTRRTHCRMAKLHDQFLPESDKPRAHKTKLDSSNFSRRPAKRELCEWWMERRASDTPL